MWESCQLLCCFVKLTDENKVKLTDVGVAKNEKDVTGTMCGTLLYLAPEVLDGQIYDSKSDMYSFGMILWEMWYAKTAFQTEMAIRSQTFHLLNDIKGGLRPGHTVGRHQPWGEWQLVMETCWDGEPQHRLTAQQGWKEFDKLRKKHRCSGHDLPAAEQNPPSKPPAPKPRLAPKPQVAPKPPRPTPKPKTPNQASASFSTKTGDANLHFSSVQKH